ncbi:signal recognition particle-docking protein FtsY [Methanolobus tindarius DSM 2278]|uniref:Signal recognition particle receptor FtsY n=1 Tax=Methanolobus tindarius DSM 2278 TaxID=1090322 RepID=W9DNY9_METTI|nr:signal recognition particle-docking protein FtsY [Methanolobus tindarius]ETA66740.1 signal recognition particle-docking protein FtsY [Methanolobus tindarius DSM 2278]
MFNKLKAKLSGFKDKIGSKIDEKAVAIESVEEIVEEIVESDEELESPVSISPSSQEVLEEKPEIPAEETRTDPKEESKTTKKFGFAQKAKALVFEREFILEEDDLEEPLWDLEMALLESDIALSVSEAIVNSVKSQLVGTRRRIGSNTGNIVEDALKNAIYDVMSANVFDLDEYVEKAEKPVHIVFIGINGTGKTTSIAKLSKRFKDQGMSVVVAAGDTFRAGAIDQLAIHADNIGVKIIKHQEQGDPAAVIYDAMQHAKAHNVDVVLSDTAGRMHTNINLMEQLKKVCRVAPPDLIIFVDEAVAGNDAVERAAQFNDAVPISGSILTKTDADSKGGAAISIAYITGKPILFLGMGQGYDDIRKFDPQWFVDQLFGE